MVKSTGRTVEVLQRIFEKRSDYQKYVYTLGKERAYQMSVRLKDLVEEVVAKIFDPDHICAISRVYGEEHVELKAFGFKPDFWVTIADAITVEGVILDMANHQVHFCAFGTKHRSRFSSNKTMLSQT
ncbi:hypothetical protein ANCCAN_12716 [Ancylostoma caninum]|uniref:Uncharacterized protein n=1 Tax=Ancylostoma caninum TaxID=29170 RepID=A0A368GA99_ANCCA|nr:hypothetical protein ANCCAN_12716 [Ancylostoma caninum]